MYTQPAKSVESTDLKVPIIKTQGTLHVLFNHIKEGTNLGLSLDKEKTKKKCFETHVPACCCIY